ncbi:DUF559 domain-containing protein [soil metagenome]
MRALAATQHGLVSRAQAREVGATFEILRRCTALEWEPAGSSVLRLVGSVATDHQRCMAAVLSAGRGALASGITAAFLWSLPGFGPRPLHVSRSHGAKHRRSPLAILHHTRFLPAHHGRLHEGIPVTSVARTVFDLAAWLHPARTERALDNALHRRLVALEELRAVAIELFEHGRTGTVLMRELLEARGAGYIPVASGLEARFLALLVAAGIELPERQVDLGGECWVGRVDFYYRRLRLIIEIDGEAFHTSKLDRELDSRRDCALRAAGFEVLRIKEHLLRGQPEEVIAKVRAALGLAT